MARFVMIVTGVAVAVWGVGALAAYVLGYPMSGGALGGAVGGVTAAMMIAGRGPKACPRCAAALPATRKPTSFKQALWGGWTCPNCGAEVDRQGREVTAR